METLKDRTWKEYYSDERSRYTERIDGTILEWWGRDDPEVDKILQKRGGLSFPHTYLNASLIPIVRTVRSILKCGTNKIIAIGVFHRISDFDTEKEFSLDTFRYVLGRTCELCHQKEPELIEVYLPKGPRDMDNGPQVVKTIENDVGHLVKEKGSGTALVLTGDLSHYGAYYGTKDPNEHPMDPIHDRIEEGLDLLFIQNDPSGYFYHAVSNFNDQWGPAIAAKKILEADLDYCIFSLELADYTEVLQTSPPCVVASVFYGFYPRN